MVLPTVRVMAAETKSAEARTGPTTFDWCYWHKGPSGTAKVVQIIERPSGPPYPLRACAPCREQRGLVAVSDMPEWT
jgi:hypothetical protein